MAARQEKRPPVVLPPLARTPRGEPAQVREWADRRTQNRPPAAKEIRK